MCQVPFTGDSLIFRICLAKSILLVRNPVNTVTEPGLTLTETGSGVVAKRTQLSNRRVTENNSGSLTVFLNHHKVTKDNRSIFLKYIFKQQNNRETYWPPSYKAGVSGTAHF